MSVKLECVVSTPHEIHAMLMGLCMAAFAQMRTRRFPALYAAGVRYIPEPPGQEKWLLPSQVLQLGGGDCEDLVAWRVAELRMMGERATPALKTIKPGLMHCLVRRANRALECPSTRLGMHDGARVSGWRL